MASIKTAVDEYNQESNPSSDDLFKLGGKSIIALAGLLPSPWGLIPTAWGMFDSLQSYGDANCLGLPPTLGDGITPNPNESPKDPQPSSPLIIDMDGNGVKTISIDKQVFFDLDNNQFAESTGWVDQGDAILVWDRDGNGIINSGNELFGNHTVLQNGQKAANGFVALAELDINKDKVFDSLDEAWRYLQLWFDYNQNGISEEGELIKLAESGIKNINLSYRNSNFTDENGNAHRQQSSVTWKDGRVSDATDVWFNTNTAMAYYTAPVTISDDIRAMPNIIAFGNVFNLHTAMSKNPTLKYVIQEYLDTPLEERTSSLLNELIYEWTGTTDIERNSRGEHIDARKVAVVELLIGNALREGATAQLNRNKAISVEAEFNKFARYTMAQLESKTIYREAFTITSFLIDPETGGVNFDWEKLNSTVVQLVNENNFIEAKRVLSIAQDLGIYNSSYVENINENFKILSENNKIVSLLFNTTLVPNTLADNTLSGTDKDDLLLADLINNTLDARYGNDVLIGGEGNDLLKGGVGSDTYIFSSGHGQDVIEEAGHWMHYKDSDTVRFTDANYADVKFRQLDNDLMLYDYSFDDSLTIKDYYSGNADNRIENFEFADRILTLKEMQEEGMKLFGMHGNDNITHKDSKAIVDGGDGDDHISTGSASDVLIGGAGNDTLNGGLGSDVYEFSKGHGQDVIQERGHWMHYEDRDTVRFSDVNYDEVKFRREEGDLTLFGYHTDDSVTIKGFYANKDNQIENFVFSDRTLTLNELKTEGMQLVGTAGDDIINDWDETSVIDAGLGNDTINADDGNDTLIGGAGNDALNGGLGSDTYIFRKGHGQDVIQEKHYWMRLNEKDTLQFDDVAYSEVKFKRADNDLILFGYQGNDSVTIKEFYANKDNQIENFVFSDRTLTLKEMQEEGMRLVGTNSNDNITYTESKAIIDGGAGDDVITTGNGDDTLIGGRGNDTLNGGYGSDTYLFAQGHGQDVIQEKHYWMHLNARDTLRFTDIANPEALWFDRREDDLVITELSDKDQTQALDRVTIKGWYANSDNRVEHIRLADERALTLNGLDRLISAMAGFTENYGGNISIAPQDEAKQYLTQLNVASYWGN